MRRPADRRRSRPSAAVAAARALVGRSPPTQSCFATASRASPTDPGCSNRPLQSSTDRKATPDPPRTMLFVQYGRVWSSRAARVRAARRGRFVRHRPSALSSSSSSRLDGRSSEINQCARARVIAAPLSGVHGRSLPHRPRPAAVLGVAQAKLNCRHGRPSILYTSGAMEAEMAETPSSAVVADGPDGRQTSSGVDDAVDDKLPLSEAIEQAVRQVTQTFSKPAPDRDRLFLAVQAVVSGDMTIKEAAVTYQFATSTMHPYVHRARATLGERAPPVKINRPTTRRRPQAQQSALVPAQSPPRPSSSAAGGDDQAIDLSIKGNEAGKATNTLDDDEPGQLIIDESGSGNANVKAEAAVEEAAREAIRLVAGDSVASARDALLHAVLRSLSDCSTAPKATSSASGDAAPSTQLVADCVDRARALLAACKDDSALQIRVTTPSLDEIEEATKRVIKGSHYHGADKERLFKAVVQTVRGDLPLTQAAATHSIPFSTLHPYVKKVRVHLGIIEASDDLKKSPSGHKRAAAASNESSPDQAKRAKRHSSSTGGSSGSYQPFKQLDIPQSWKDNSEVMETAVWGAVQGCQYDDPQKKERLCSAVMEALSGRKTMKAAAAMHEVPFTTLQTYFHRSRARLQRAYGQVPDSDLDDGDISGADEDVKNASSNTAKIALTPTSRGSKRKGSALDSLLVKLTGHPATGDGTNDANGSAAASLFDAPRERTPPASGSNKRKPKKVVRLAESNGAAADDAESASVKLAGRGHEGPPVPVNANEVLMAQFLALAAAAAHLNGQTTVEAGQVVAVEPKAPEEDNNDYMWDSFDQSIDFTIDGGACDADELLRSAERDDEGKIVMTNELAVDRAILNCPYEGETQQRLKWAVLDTLDGTSTAKEASREYVIPLSALNTYCSRARAIVDAVKNGDEAEAVLRGSTTSTPKADRKRKQSGTPTLSTTVYRPLDAEDAERMALIEEAVDNACKSSLYPGPQKERLREAVMLVIRGDMTINAAANMKQLPSSTVHPYVHRARAALGADLPPQATGPTPWPSYGSKKKTEDDIADSPVSRSEASPSPALSTASSASKMKSTPLALSAAAEELGLSAKKLDGMSAKATLRLAKQAALEHTANGPTVNLEEADKAIGELVKSSLYDDAGRQRLYEAILMVTTLRAI
uniref:HTH psq-type domain-containing protein n=1 Tax=Plectus sambesii TaxID=2011161 RepID=A0A914XFP5_9BILA